jgi:hypothetical protein
VTHRQRFVFVVFVAVTWVSLTVSIAVAKGTI